MSVNGEIVFSISDFNLEFQEIKNNILINNYAIIRKGQSIGILKDKKAPYDIWSCEIELSELDSINDKLLELLKALLPYSIFINKISHRYQQVCVDIYLRSEYGQIGFSLNKEIYSFLDRLGVQINFHILSFGKVED